jgi:hypothetical protein
MEGGIRRAAGNALLMCIVRFVWFGVVRRLYNSSAVLGEFV